MKCERCGQWSDPRRDDGGWEPLHDDSDRVIRPLFECPECSHRQRLR